MDQNGWVQLHTEQKPAATGSGTVEIRSFRLTREAWARKEAERTA
jgi:hypothetical protein